ncbi:MAG: aminodeoxychorismate/anthranilate synthase component II [Gemmatimonadetes bacterium]|jgi:anthranilate synthase component 2|nr:aminodeoxychorismate/anthranilate synthase component II [Gemmatimonadota bacterium]MDE0961803.1 aminodeoxychorismate/anthranilate synthase component II [Candidatus Latescibacterota bacterium]MBT5324725.1 aminodeoxychorismate/anthranilate synthase component II [Gemmatimonadota bacterium]MBT5450092.1 aminodeoxychorismate/anthranilate synthase component II [Gemmatimonadota bacterium]MBT5800454.1 aminodeoxychorismate/anthranilate synthase component II [Gemmatimonadota bacterium]
MLLVLDNYDSFTYNLVQYLEELGAETRTFRNDELTVDEAVALAPERVVISPGPATPEQAGISLALVERLGGSLPILGVCLGHQVIAQAYGGRVVEANEIVHGRTSAVRHDGRTLFAGLQNPLVATRYHSLTVDPERLPDSLEVSAESEDGTIMGLRHRHWPVEGVQFHPESILTIEGKQLLANFLRI